MRVLLLSLWRKGVLPGCREGELDLHLSWLASVTFESPELWLGPLLLGSKSQATARWVRGGLKASPSTPEKMPLSPATSSDSENPWVWSGFLSWFLFLFKTLGPPVQVTVFSASTVVLVLLVLLTSVFLFT